MIVSSLPKCDTHEHVRYDDQTQKQHSPSVRHIMLIYIYFWKPIYEVVEPRLRCIQCHVDEEHQASAHISDEDQTKNKAQCSQGCIIIHESLIYYDEYFLVSFLVGHYNQQYQDIYICMDHYFLQMLFDIHYFVRSMQEETKTYEKLMKIGEGAYGAVYKARNIYSNQVVALKVTRFDMDDEGVPSTTLREITILKSLKHPNIVKLLDINHGMDKEQFVIQLVFEYMDEDLGKFIRRRKDDIEESECKVIFKKIVEGVKYMHSHKVYHRDLKPQNILINQKNDVKIADFGLSRVIVNPKRTFSKQIQTLWYRSPQLLLGTKHYGMGVDVWSLGCIFYQLVEGKVLFKGDSQISQIFVMFGALGTPKQHEWPAVVNLPYFKRAFPKMNRQNFNFNKLSPEGSELLMRMIEVNPQKRINVNQILNHPYFSDL